MVILLFFLFLFPSLSAEAPKQDLFLEAFLDTNTEWYPGQQGDVVYKIWYRGEILLTKENFPLLNLAGLEKVGDKVFYEYKQGDFSIQEITQTYKALKPGTFTATPSEIEGVRYSLVDGQKKIIPPTIKSSIPAYAVTIKPFPQESKPDGFDGSIGSGRFELLPLSISETRSQEWIPITIVAKGFGEKGILNPPNFDCLPGFPGFFKQDPNSLEIKKDPKTDTISYTFRILAENRLPTQIPPILWSYFDPTAKQYHTFKTDPIPITIKDETLVSNIKPVILKTLSETDTTITPVSIPHYNSSFNFPFWFDRHWMIFHLVLALLIVGYALLHKPIRRRYLQYKLNPLHRTEKILKKENDPMVIAKVLDQLLRQTLRKKGSAQNPHAKETREFLEELEKFRFSPEKNLSKQTMVDRALNLYKMLAVFILLPFLLSADPINDHIEKGNQASTWIERETEWNEALQLLSLEKPTQNRLMTTAFLLDELDAKPLSYAYLKMAKRLSPSNRDIALKMHSLENELGIPPFKSEMLPSPMLKLFTVLLVLLAIFFYFRRMRTYSYILGGIAYALVALIAVESALTPRTAIVLNPTWIYSHSDMNAIASKLPLIPGESVQIVEMSEEDFKIYSPNQKLCGWIAQKEVLPLP